jgi:serine/threonine protein phosphatase PrpC
MSEHPHTSPVLFSEEPPAPTTWTERPWPNLGERVGELSLMLKHRLAHRLEATLEYRVFLGVALDEGSEGREVEVWVAPAAQARALADRRRLAREAWVALSPDVAPAAAEVGVSGEWACLIAPAPAGAPLTPPVGVVSASREAAQGRVARAPRWLRRESETPQDSPSDAAINQPNTEQEAVATAQLVERAEPLLKLLERLHAAELTLGALNPEHLCVEGSAEGPRARPRWAMDLLALRRPLSMSSSELPAHLGYSPPESYGHFHAAPGAEADVFSVGMWLFYAITGVAPLQETRRPNHRLPAPNVYHPSVSPELAAVVRRATSPSPRRRYADAAALRGALRWAARSAAQRATRRPSALHIEVGHDIHVGLLKGQYNPTNQDDLFLGYQPERERGLFLVTDGVSISEHGSGDVASGFVRQATFEAWEALCREPSLQEEEDTLSEISVSSLQRAQPLSPRVITDLLNEANRRIGEEVSVTQPIFRGPPEGIMAATAVLAFVEGDRALLASMGDSRIYLIREGHICSLMVDDDLATHLMQLGQPPAQAAQAPSSAALVNCVGEFKKSPEGRLVPVPVHPQLTLLRLLPGDTLLLCSDGIPDYAGLDEEDAERRMLAAVEGAFSAPKAAFDLITLANAGGGGDNISCVVLRFHAAQEEPA